MGSNSKIEWTAPKLPLCAFDHEMNRREEYPKWFSVYDEPPPTGKHVLTYTGWGDYYDVLYFQSGRWFRDEMHNVEPPTHWQFLTVPEISIAPGSGRGCPR